MEWNECVAEAKEDSQCHNKILKQIELIKESYEDYEEEHKEKLNGN